jgi:hypothetical protein
MTNLVDIPNIIENSFGIKSEAILNDDHLDIRMKGIDNCSLAKYILDKCDNVKITVKEREGYKFSDLGWVKIEKSIEKEIRYF